jgi:hypothetical protein
MNLEDKKTDGNSILGLPITALRIEVYPPLSTWRGVQCLLTLH